MQVSVKEYTEAERLEYFRMFVENRFWEGKCTQAEAENGAYQDWRKIVGPRVPAPKAIQEVVMKARKELGRAATTGL